MCKYKCKCKYVCFRFFAFFGVHDVWMAWYDENVTIVTDYDYIWFISGDTLTEEEVMLLVNAADKDSDGTLDFEEFVKIMLD